MLKYQGFVKNIFDWANIGGDTIVLLILRLSGTTNKNFKLGYLFKKIIYDPFIFANNSFYKIRSINSDWDAWLYVQILGRNVKIDLA
jgi:hypothetical protein